MQKSIHSAEYEAFLEQLKAAREEAGVTQVELADRLQITQSTVSKCERGERRLDIVEVRRWCHALGLVFADFCDSVDRALPPPRRQRSR